MKFFGSLDDAHLIDIATIRCGIPTTIEVLLTPQKNIPKRCFTKDFALSQNRKPTNFLERVTWKLQGLFTVHAPRCG